MCLIKQKTLWKKEKMLVPALSPCPTIVSKGFSWGWGGGGVPTIFPSLSKNFPHWNNFAHFILQITLVFQKSKLILVSCYLRIAVYHSTISAVTEKENNEPKG